MSGRCIYGPTQFDYNIFGKYKNLEPRNLYILIPCRQGVLFVRPGSGVIGLREMAKTWYWDEVRRRYVDREGRVLPEREIRKAIDEYIDSIQEDIDSKVDEFILGGITLFMLFNWLDGEISAMHHAAGSIAYGGIEQVTESEWNRIDRRLQSEREYLAGFRADMEQAASGGELSFEGVAGRAGLYAESAFKTYENTVSDRERESGAIGVRRRCVEDQASCDDCVALAADEYVGFDEIMDIGDGSSCMSNCRCWFEFSYETDVGVIEPIEIERGIYA